MIYFNKNKQAFGFRIDNPLCVLSKEQWQEYSVLKLGEEYDVTSEGIVDLRNTQEYKEKQALKEKERISKLSLTKREVFLALYKAKGITPEQIKSQITDTAALIEFDYANEYFRGNPLIDLIGEKLGYSSDDLDYLFENKELPENE